MADDNDSSHNSDTAQSAPSSPSGVTKQRSLRPGLFRRSSRKKPSLSNSTAALMVNDTKSARNAAQQDEQDGATDTATVSTRMKQTEHNLNRKLSSFFRKNRSNRNNKGGGSVTSGGGSSSVISREDSVQSVEAPVDVSDLQKELADVTEEFRSSQLANSAPVIPEEKSGDFSTPFGIPNTNEGSATLVKEDNEKADEVPSDQPPVDAPLLAATTKEEEESEAPEAPVLGLEEAVAPEVGDAEPEQAVEDATPSFAVRPGINDTSQDAGQDAAAAADTVKKETEKVAKVAEEETPSFAVRPDDTKQDAPTVLEPNVEHGDAEDDPSPALSENEANVADVSGIMEETVVSKEINNDDAEDENGFADTPMGEPRAVDQPKASEFQEPRVFAKTESMETDPSLDAYKDAISEADPEVLAAATPELVAADPNKAEASPVVETTTSTEGKDNEPSTSLAGNAYNREVAVASLSVENDPAVNAYALSPTVDLEPQNTSTAATDIPEVTPDVSATPTENYRAVAVASLSMENEPKSSATTRSDPAPALPNDNESAAESFSTPMEFLGVSDALLDDTEPLTPEEEEELEALQRAGMAFAGPPKNNSVAPTSAPPSVAPAETQTPVVPSVSLPAFDAHETSTLEAPVSSDHHIVRKIATADALDKASMLQEEEDLNNGTADAVDEPADDRDSILAPANALDKGSLLEEEHGAPAFLAAAAEEEDDHVEDHKEELLGSTLMPTPTHTIDDSGELVKMEPQPVPEGDAVSTTTTEPGKYHNDDDDTTFGAEEEDDNVDDTIDHEHVENSEANEAIPAVSATPQTYAQVTALSSHPKTTPAADKDDTDAATSLRQSDKPDQKSLDPAEILSSPPVAHAAAVTPTRNKEPGTDEAGKKLATTDPSPRSVMEDVNKSEPSLAEHWPESSALSEGQALEQTDEGETFLNDLVRRVSTTEMFEPTSVEAPGGSNPFDAVATPETSAEEGLIPKESKSRLTDPRRSSTLDEIVKEELERAISDATTGSAAEADDNTQEETNKFIGATSRFAPLTEIVNEEASDADDLTTKSLETRTESARGAVEAEEKKEEGSEPSDKRRPKPERHHSRELIPEGLVSNLVEGIEHSDHDEMDINPEPVTRRHLNIKDTSGDFNFNEAMTETENTGESNKKQTDAETETRPAVVQEEEVVESSETGTAEDIGGTLTTEEFASFEIEVGGGGEEEEEEEEVVENAKSRGYVRKRRYSDGVPTMETIHEDKAEHDFLERPLLSMVLDLAKTVVVFLVIFGIWGAVLYSTHLFDTNRSAADGPRKKFRRNSRMLVVDRHHHNPHRVPSRPTRAPTPASPGFTKLNSNSTHTQFGKHIKKAFNESLHQMKGMTPNKWGCRVPFSYMANPGCKSQDPLFDIDEFLDNVME